ncbi:MAG: hypothetical protein KTM48_03180, partial [Wolbachia endosymbiont of Pissodes strobi]|nr:hypothetical protein [Wolbachia endosymbiont of Pissodes strobi]
ERERERERESKGKTDRNGPSTGLGKRKKESSTAGRNIPGASLGVERESSIDLNGASDNT